MSAAKGEMSGFVEGMGRVALLAGEVLRTLFIVRINWAELIRQMHFIGYKSQFVVLTTGASTGMVFCAQTFFQFHKVKMDTAALSVVGVAMTSELGPVLAGLMVAGRVGAAMTAEIGTMRVTQQIDALRTMATDPVDYLVVPRFIATVISMPLLTILAWLVGIGAAYLLAGKFLGIEEAFALKHMYFYTDAEDVLMGVIKSLVFGALISLISCYHGLNCGKGAEGVGRATNEAVVHSCIAILISNFFLTLFLRAVLYPS
jgi:phospholipid/cholesterol/gamma-HCH transport system permease protein